MALRLCPPSPLSGEVKERRELYIYPSLYVSHAQFKCCVSYVDHTTHHHKSCMFFDDLKPHLISGYWLYSQSHFTRAQIRHVLSMDIGKLKFTTSKFPLKNNFRIKFRKNWSTNSKYQMKDTHTERKSSKRNSLFNPLKTKPNCFI
jgi:hypothetical protein